MKHSLLALTAISIFLFSGCNRDGSCSSCAHDETEHPACSTCPTTLPTEQFIEINSDDIPNDEIQNIIIDKEISQK